METVINLEKWLIIKLDHYDYNREYEITTDDYVLTLDGTY